MSKSDLMEDYLETFPIRKNGERRAPYLRRIFHWLQMLKRNLNEMRSKKPFIQTNSWIEIETPDGNIEFYVNIKELLRILEQ